MARLDVGHITLNISDSGGRNHPLIFIPGLVGLLDAWQYQVAHFSSRYRCISLDHRGAGDSDKPAGADQYSTAAIARDVVALMDTLGIDKAHIAGTSTGGCVLQNICIDHPERVRCAIFSNTWVKADEYITRVQMTRRRVALSHGAEEYVKLSSLFTNGPMQFRYNLDRVMALEARAMETIAAPEVLAQRIDMTLTHDRSGEIGKIRAPALVVGTRDDLTVPFYQSEDLASAIPGAQLIVVDEGGHYSYRRHWQQWNALVEPFLNENEERA
jgi:aminoacrylate hydrolase